MAQRRIVLTTMGSLGDLHPYVALAIGLQHRGHSCIIATNAIYREKVERERIEFAAIRPDLSDLGNECEVMAKIMHPRYGSRYVIRNLAMAWIQETYEDLLKATQGADLLIGHPLTFTVPLVAEKTNTPWIGTALQPMVFISPTDPPAFGPIRWLVDLNLGPKFYAWLFRAMKKFTFRWAKPLIELRKREGLSEDPKHPLFESVYSDLGNLALFSSQFATPQPNWPANTVITGFPFYDVGMEKQHSGISEGLETFLRSGAPPIIFTLGSSAVMTAGTFYSESFKAAKQAGFRAVLLIGRDERNRFTDSIPPNIYIDDYAPYSQIFPRAAAIFHQGGVGTTAQAMRAGKPMVIMPFSHDQPDHARRIERMGCGFGISRRAYSAARVIELVRKLSSQQVQENAARLGEKIRSEDGVLRACEAIESFMNTAQTPKSI